MAITIEGLNSRQRALADIIWSMNGRDQVSQFIRTLPEQQRREAQTVLELMIAAVFDDAQEIQPETTKLLDKFRI